MKKEEEEGEEEDRGRTDGGKREGEAAELPADPSSISVEANDAKTGVHCPQLRAWKERKEEREKERERERENIVW